MDSTLKQQEFLNVRADQCRKKLEDQIAEMRRTIDDLKQKVIEQKEQLLKERNENDRMIEDQESFRRQLSMFHLPHCPVLNSPPCPVHSRHSFPHTVSPRVGMEEDIFQGDQGLKMHDGDELYDNIIREMGREAEGSCEDLFKVNGNSPRSPEVTHPHHSSSRNDVKNFTLMMMDSCRSRLREAQQQKRADESRQTTSSPQCAQNRSENCS